MCYGAPSPAVCFLIVWIVDIAGGGGPALKILLKGPVLARYATGFQPEDIG